MICSLWLIVPAGIFILESIQTGRLSIPDRVQRFSKGLNRLLLIVPLLAVAVFAVLFLFVLKGRFYERLCHAAIVLALWLYAARFYWFLISFFKHRRMLAFAIPGMAGFAATAIVLTPLDRYVDLLHSFTGAGSVLVGCGMLAVYYAAPLLFPRGRTAKPEQP